MTRIALYSGSFDPLTNGHLDVLRQALSITDRIVVAIGVHAEKRALFSFAERERMIREVLTDELGEADAGRVDIKPFSGLVVDAAREAGACMILRGLRNGGDLEYEMQMSGMNGTMNPDVRTVFLASTPGYGHITATLVRQISAMGGDVTPFVPRVVVRWLADKKNAS